MSSNHDHSHCQCGCCASMDRRDFMTTVGLSALAAQGGLTAMLSAGEPAAETPRPRVRAVFLRGKEDKYWMGWPGASYDIPARQADYTKAMVDAAAQLGVDLQIDAGAVADMAAIEKLLAQCKQSPPDGVVLTVMGLSPDFWPLAERFVAQRGDIPTVVFSPMGTSFTGHLQSTRKAKKCFVAATQDYTWLATGIRMFSAISQMRNTRLCIINGEKTHDQKLNGVGATLHHIPLRRWIDELAKLETTAEVKALADKFAKTARKIVEPNGADLVNAAKTYFVAKRIMAAENCNGISLNCLGLIGNRLIPCPPCMAWSTLNDEGGTGICECDWNAGLGLRLCSVLLGRAGFMQDPAPNTVNGTLMGAHCTSATRLAGFDRPAMPIILRSHSESGLGISPQVLWPVGEPVTVLTFQGPQRFLVGTGRVVANIDTPPSGGCRTSVELQMDGVADPRDCNGFHQVFILGKHERLLRAYAQLSGLEVGPIA
jgi:hypothetical protein